MRTRSRVIAMLVVLLLFAAVAQAQFTPLVKFIPSGANTIILLNAEKVLNSEAALREGWRQNFQKAIEAGMIRLPEDTKQYILASQMDFEHMHPNWQVGASITKNPHSMATVAKKRGGKRDTVVGRHTVLLPTGSYIVEIDPNTFVGMNASRQTVSRVIREAEEGGGTLSPYIREAVGFSEVNKTEVIMAIDLTDVVDMTRLKEDLADSEAIAKKGLESDQVANALITIRGVTLGITIGDRAYGKMKIDFGRDVSFLKDVARSMVLEVLGDQGAMIDDFESWEADAGGTQITFGGYLSPTGRRQIFSLIDAPSTAMVEPQKETTQQDTSPSEAEPMEIATQKYFKSITEYMSDLRNKEPQKIAQYGIWFDKYARKIDGLPMVNVDEYALDYGAYVSQQFRNAGAAIKGIGVQSRVGQVNATRDTAGFYGDNYYGGGFYHGGYYWNGGYGGSFARANAMQQGLRNQQSARTQVRVQAKAVGTSAARAIMQDLNNATGQVRRELTKKYNVEF